MDSFTVTPTVGRLRLKHWKNANSLCFTRRRPTEDQSKREPIVSRKRKQQQRRWKALKLKQENALILTDLPYEPGYKQPNYLPRLLELARQAGPGIHRTVTSHDDWCALWRGGICDCNPTVTLRKSG